MSSTRTEPPLAPALLLKAARRMLRPLVRLLMSNGVTFPVLAELLRGLFVEVAVGDILTTPKQRTDSRISLLTGIHRKEIRRLRELPADAETEPRAVTLGSAVIARWTGGAPYVDTGGQPLALPRSAADGPSFDTLVASVTTDVRPRAMLEDLLGHGAVTVESDLVRLNVTAFVPRPGGEEQMYYFGRNLHDHIAAAAANVSAEKMAPFLERSVHYDGLTKEQAAALRAFGRDAALEVLLDVNRRARELTAEDDAGDPNPGSRVNFGVYMYEDNAEPAARGDV